MQQLQELLLLLEKKGFHIFDFPGIDQKPKTTQPSHTIITFRHRYGRNMVAQI
jgi:hypothetical protein